MSLTFFGHACLKADDNEGHALAMDPWFSEEGAFLGSWFQFPDNTHLADEALNGVTDICISHGHEDHFDPKTLRAALAEGTTTRIHIARFATEWLVRRIRKGFPDIARHIEEHPPYQPFQVGKGISVFFVPEESPGYVDAAIVCKSSDGVLVNMNDARLTAAQIDFVKATVGDVDFLTIQGSGASEYPVMYTYSEAEMLRRSLEKRRQKLEHCLRVVDALDPRRILFCAGPPAFLAPEYAHFNESRADSVFPDQLAVIEELAALRPDVVDRTLFLMPGDALSDAYRWGATDLDSPRCFPYRHKADYLSSYAERRSVGQAHPDTRTTLDSLDSLKSYFQRMVSLSPFMAAKIGGKVTFVIEDGRNSVILTVDFEAGTISESDSEDPLYVITIPRYVFDQIVADKITWDDASLALKLRYDERTDRYVHHLKLLLKYMDRGLFQRLELYEKSLAGEEGPLEMVTVEDGNEAFVIQRRCPHAGTDLTKHSIIADGTITCLAHRLRYDLKTGYCMNARGYRLSVGQAPAVPPP